MRKVQMQRRLFNSKTQRSENVSKGEGLFHQWATDYEECENGVGLYPVAIVEMEDGQICIHPANLIKFVGEENAND